MRHKILGRGNSSPFFSIVIVDSRSDKFSHWVEKAVYSVKKQTLENIELILIENIGKEHSIGKCFNEGMKLASGRWVYFLGDDDYLSFDYLSSLKCFIDNFSDHKTVIATTNSTFFTTDGKEVSAKDKAVMGSFLKDYWGDSPFDETLEKWVDVEAYERAEKDGKEAIVCRWHYGYFYRQHNNNVSGRKVVEDERIKTYFVEENMLEKIEEIVGVDNDRI